ncbi:MAG: nucleoside triphosphate pyrophosphohydrolase [Anaerolineaceae bacterium]|jgi:tetrapyrrole methylase family protein/MazG family protein
MQKGKITVIGLGIGSAKSLTREAWEYLQDCAKLWVNNRLHPALQDLPNSVQIHSLLDLHCELIPEFVTEKLIGLALEGSDVCYAVPGSPLVADENVSLLLKTAGEQAVETRVIDGLSFLSPACQVLGLNTQNLMLADARQLLFLEVPHFPATQPILILNLTNREDATELKLTLMANYPDEYEVKLVHEAGMETQKIETLHLWEIDQSAHWGEFSTLYLPAREAGRSFEDFQEVIARLRAPDGCPWDREQTHLSLRPYLLEEAYEVLESLDQENMPHLQEELGDLLLQIVLHTQIAMEDLDFNMTDVLHGISQKLIRRHPHVFSEVNVDSVDGVITNWEKIKAAEREQNGETSSKGMLDGIPLVLPALTQADQIQKRAKRVGFDWHEMAPVIAKVREELSELEAAGSDEEKLAEAGDLLFAVVNMIRWLEIDPELALRETNLRFRKRFGYIEQKARELGKHLQDMSFEEMDSYWEEAKQVFESETRGGQAA